jgi:hypothetical protein
LTLRLTVPTIVSSHALVDLDILFFLQFDAGCSKVRSSYTTCSDVDATPPNQSKLALFRRRLQMMVITIFVPELMPTVAARQFVGARTLSNVRYRVASSSLASDGCLMHRV